MCSLVVWELLRLFNQRGSYLLFVLGNFSSGVACKSQRRGGYLLASASAEHSFTQSVVVPARGQRDGGEMRLCHGARGWRWGGGTGVHALLGFQHRIPCELA